MRIVIEECKKNDRLSTVCVCVCAYECLFMVNAAVKIDSDHCLVGMILKSSNTSPVASIHCLLFLFFHLPCCGYQSRHLAGIFHLWSSWCYVIVVGNLLLIQSLRLKFQLAGISLHRNEMIDYHTQHQTIRRAAIGYIGIWLIYSFIYLFNGNYGF